MIIFGTCAAGDGATYRTSALPSIERVRREDDEILHESGDGPGIAAVYNRFIDRARQDPACQALVLVQDDVEIIDAEFRDKVLRAVDAAEGGVVGVVGATGVTSLAWWSGEGIGSVFESRGPIVFARREGEADAVDGLLLILGRSAFGRLRFDEESFPRFHGYDVDLCFQARAAGLAVQVADIEVFHRTRGGFGDEDAFFAADRALHAKWKDRFPGLVRLERPLAAWAEPLRRARRRMQRVRSRSHDAVKAFIGASRAVLGRARRASMRLRLISPSVRGSIDPSCLACSATLQLPTGLVTLQGVLDCDDCGSGMTWPPPGVDVTTDRIWVERYAGRRFSRRHVWSAEARVRLEWFGGLTSGAGFSGTLVEIGSGAGEFIEVAREHGFTAFGIEPSTAAVAAAASAGVPLFEGRFDEWRSMRPDEPIDAVVLWHVLEHIPRPLDLLGEIRGALQNGGRIALEVPNWGSTAAQRLGHAWPLAQLSDHTVHFTTDGLRTLLARAGFVSVVVEPWSEECYASERTWTRRRNDALKHQLPWPPYDLLRATASVP